MKRKSGCGCGPGLLAFGLFVAVVAGGSDDPDTGRRTRLMLRRGTEATFNSLCNQGLGTRN